MRQRKTIIFSLLIFSGIICTKAVAEDRYPLSFALETEKPVVIDGVLNEEGWRKAPKVGSFVKIYDNTKEAQPQTFFRVVYDKERLYFGIRAEEPDTSRLILKETTRDMFPGGVSSMEIFLDANSDADTYYQLAANLLGNRYDGYMDDKKWNTDWQVAVKIDKNSWTMEIGILFKDLGVSMPKKGSAWGLNVTRNREGGQSGSSSWAEVGGNFHNPGKFNTLIFGNPLDWWEKEVTDCKKESLRLHQTLNKFEPREETLEQKLKAVDQLMQELSLQRKNLSSGNIADFFPLYSRMQRLKEKYQGIAKEVEVVSALQ